MVMNFLNRIRGAFNRLTGRVAPTRYMTEIEDHFRKIFGSRDEDGHRVFHELCSEYVHLDVHVLAPTEEFPFQVLFTTGMSDLEMTFSEDEAWDFKKVHGHAELFCLLPPDWKLEFDKHSTAEERKRQLWIVEALKDAARHPHEFGTWIGNAHTFQYDPDNEPFADNTRLSSAIFIALDYKDFDGRFGDDLNGFSTEDNTYINLLCFIPIYEDELNYQLENNGVSLFERLFGKTVTGFERLIVDIHRENVCMNRAI